MLLTRASLPSNGRRESRIAIQELVVNEQGGYQFLPGVPFLSFGVVAADGFEIVRTTFRQPRPFAAGLADIERLLKGSGRSLHALCGLELRSARPLSRSELDEFNRAYLALKAAGLLVGDDVPVARTNVAFSASGMRATGKSGAPDVAIHAWSHSRPTTRGVRATAPTFVLAGMPEIRNLRAARLGASRRTSSPSRIRRGWASNARSASPKDRIHPDGARPDHANAGRGVG